MQSYSLLIEIGSLLFAALSYYKQSGEIRFLNSNYRNLIFKEILTKTKHKDIFHVINRNIGLLNINEIFFALIFLLLEFSLIYYRMIYVFILVVVISPIIATIYHLKLTWKDGFDLLNIIFKNKQLNKKEKRQLGIYGFMTYLFVINLTFFLFIGFLENNSLGLTESYFLAVVLLFIVPQYTCIFLMQYKLRIDFTNIIAELLKIYSVKVKTWVSVKDDISLSIEGVAIMMYPHLTLDTPDGKRMIVKWKDVKIIGYSISEKLENY